LPEFAGSLSPGCRNHGWVVVTPGAASPSSPQEPRCRRRVGLGFLGQNPSRNWPLWAATTRGGAACGGGSKPYAQRRFSRSGRRPLSDPLRSLRSCLVVADGALVLGGWWCGPSLHLVAPSARCSYTRRCLGRRGCRWQRAVEALTAPRSCGGAGHTAPASTDLAPWI